MHFGIQLLHTRSSTPSGFSPKTSYRASLCHTSPQANSRGRALALLQERRRFVLRELTRDEEVHALAHVHTTIRTYTVPLFCSSGSKVCACVRVFVCVRTSMPWLQSTLVIISGTVLVAAENQPHNGFMHVETPDRVKVMWNVFGDSGLLSKCTWVQRREFCETPTICMLCRGSCFTHTLLNLFGNSSLLNKCTSVTHTYTHAHAHTYLPFMLARVHILYSLSLFLFLCISLSLCFCRVFLPLSCIHSVCLCLCASSCYRVLILIYI